MKIKMVAQQAHPVTWVVIEEVKSGDWGVGGAPLTTDDVQALAAGKSKVNA